MQDFRDYEWRKVDSPYYEPLGQSIPVQETQTPTKEEILKAKRRDYQRRYYEEHKEKMRQYMRDYYKWKRTGGELKWIQLEVYNYMVEQYQLWDRVPRATQIAKALNMWEQTIYNAAATLVKKWYIGRWALGKYYLINPPKEDKDEITKTNDIGLVAEQPENNWYISSLTEIFTSWLMEQNKQLYEENQKLRETLRKIKEAWMEHENRFDEFERAWNQSYWDLDWIIMNR